MSSPIAPETGNTTEAVIEQLTNIEQAAQAASRGITEAVLEIKRTLAAPLTFTRFYELLGEAAFNTDVTQFAEVVNGGRRDDYVDQKFLALKEMGHMLGQFDAQTMLHIVVAYKQRQDSQREALRRVATRSATEQAVQA